MPTDVAIGQRRKSALQRIVKALGSTNELELPRFKQVPNNVRQMKQIEFLAEYIEQNVQVQETTIPEKYIKAEQLARENANKADIVAALLENADG